MVAVLVLMLIDHLLYSLEHYKTIYFDNKPISLSRPQSMRRLFGGIVRQKRFPLVGLLIYIFMLQFEHLKLPSTLPSKQSTDILLFSIWKLI